MRKTVIAAGLMAGLVWAQNVEEKLDTPQAHAYVVTLQPHMPVTAQNGHVTNRVLIYLDDGATTRQVGHGAVEKFFFHRGDVRWRPASGAYTAENVGARPVRILEVDLKGKPSGPAPVSKIDPSVVDAKHYKVVLENDQVRVLRIHYGPHEKGPEHEHILNRVVLFLNDQKNGKTDDVHVSGAQTHVEENPGDQVADRIAVELK